MSLLTDHDLYLFNEGSHIKLYERLGSHPRRIDDVEGTNFAVWATSTTRYAKTWDGLLECYAAGVPFYRNTLMADTIYVVVLFGGLAVVQWAFPSLRESAATPALASAKPQAA